MNGSEKMRQINDFEKQQLKTIDSKSSTKNQKGLLILFTSDTGKSGVFHVADAITEK